MTKMERKKIARAALDALGIDYPKSGKGSGVANLEKILLLTGADVAALHDAADGLGHDALAVRKLDRNTRHSCISISLFRAVYSDLAPICQQRGYVACEEVARSAASSRSIAIRRALEKSASERSI